ncbi:hypothetical protein BgiBS90_022502 [Biomphalaria glabrata]|nr:hypothetical protein BgiBS90_022502 [Biomphalaria glabrata]
MVPLRLIYSSGGKNTKSMKRKVSEECLADIPHETVKTKLDDFQTLDEVETENSKDSKRLAPMFSQLVGLTLYKIKVATSDCFQLHYLTVIVVSKINPCCDELPKLCSLQVSVV